MHGGAELGLKKDIVSLNAGGPFNSRIVYCHSSSETLLDLKDLLPRISSGNREN